MDTNSGEALGRDNVMFVDVEYVLESQKDEPDSARISQTRKTRDSYHCLMVTLIVFIVIGYLLMIVNTGIALFCLQQYGISTTICRLETEAFSAADELRSTAETLEPVISVLVVATVLVFMFNAQHIRSYLLRVFKRKCDVLKLLFKTYWFTSYVVMIILSFIYHICTFALDVGSSVEGAVRYITLPLGMTSWFILLVVFNECGAMTTVVRDRRKRLYSRESVQQGGLTELPWLPALYKALLVFAGVTNFVEFLIYSVYLADMLVTVRSNFKLLEYMSFIGMSLTVAIRYNFASYFFQLIYIGEKKFKLLEDPWSMVKK
ncbi:uncharacterized protein LOC144448882 isoform X2 [Glandiceps talaboti]